MTKPASLATYRLAALTRYAADPSTGVTAHDLPAAMTTAACRARTTRPAEPRTQLRYGNTIRCPPAFLRATAAPAAQRTEQP